MRVLDDLTSRRARAESGLTSTRLAVIAALAVIALTLATRSEADPAVADPSMQPIPTVEPETDAKSITAQVSFTERSAAEVVGTVVAYGAAHSHVGDPPLLLLQLHDGSGSVLEEFNAWHPLWAFVETSTGGERRVILDSAVGDFIVPFHRDATKLVITDMPLAQEVATIDLTGGIKEFCQTNPDDSDCRVADLEVSDVEVTTEPDLSLVGETAAVGVETTYTNNGPSTPVDAAVTQLVSGGGGLTVTPSSATVAAAALAVGDVRTSSQTYEVRCDAPGSHELIFTSTIEPDHPADVDISPANNSDSTVLTVECVVPVAINIQPGESPNSVNVARRQGAIPVAILSTASGEYGLPLPFDATTVDPSTANFGQRATILSGGGARAFRDAGHQEDSSEPDDQMRDGDLDLVIQFVRPSDTGLQKSDTEACALGSFSPDGGTSWLKFFGCDDIRVIR